MRILINPETRARHHLETARISAMTRKYTVISRFNQPRGVEAVEPAEPRIVVRQVAGQGAQVALGGQNLGQIRDLAGFVRSNFSGKPDWTGLAEALQQPPASR